MKNLKPERLLKTPLPELLALANKVRKNCLGGKFELCSIVNAKSGSCGEDCKFCAQSRRHGTKIPTYPLKGKKEIVKAARRAKKQGAERFGIVTSGQATTKKELAVIAEAIKEIKSKVGIKVCASLGKLNIEALLTLKNAGLSRYHHNIETSPGHFPKICGTHKLRERLDTIASARKAGLEVCSGGILGMGESWQDRIEMALLLKKLDVDHVPLNLLVPIKGTPLESLTPISRDDAIRAICIFRIILRGKGI